MLTHLYWLLYSRTPSLHAAQQVCTGSTAKTVQTWLRCLLLKGGCAACCSRVPALLALQQVHVPSQALPQ